MNNHPSPSIVRRNLTRMVAILVILALYSAARLPDSPSDESKEWAAQFNFKSFALPELEGDHSRTVREVHPQLEHISGWISAVGAAVALHDLDNDAYANDVCYVDTRTDKVLVGPVPGTGDRYPPFELAPKTPTSGAAPMGCIPADLNEDGLLDILVYYWGRPPVAFLRTAFDPSASLSASGFIEQPLFDPQIRWHTNAATLADFDGDGHIDIVIGNYFPDGARVIDSDSSDPQTMHKSMTRAFNGGRNCFLRWTGASSGAQPSVSYECIDILEDDVAMGWTLAVAAADLDGDLLPEIYFANDFGPDRLLHNRSTPGKLEFAIVEGRKTLSTPSSKVVGNDGFKGMGIDFGDINGDGHLDMYVSNIAAEWALQESHFVWMNTAEPDAFLKGRAPFKDKSEPMGLSRSSWGWESRLDDFNNDGVLEAVQATGFLKGDVDRWPELHEVALSNDNLINLPEVWFQCRPGDDISGHDHNCFFVQSKSGRFFDIAKAIGLEKPWVTRGIATGDVDGDGDLDMAFANQWDTSQFYRNDSKQDNNFLGLRLRLPLEKRTASHVVEDLARIPNSRTAIGASVQFITPEGKVKVAQVDGGNGHSGVRSPDVHFGLGQEYGPFEVTVRYRDPEGNACEEKLTLRPGWNTILLGWDSTDKTKLIALKNETKN